MQSPTITEIGWGTFKHYPVFTCIFTQTTLTQYFNVCNLACSVLVPVGVGIHDMAAHDGMDDACIAMKGQLIGFVMVVKYILYVCALIVLTYSSLKKWAKAVQGVN